MQIKNILEFASIYGKLKTNTHTLEDVSEIIWIVNQMDESVTNEAKAMIMEIPLYVLQNEVELSIKDEDVAGRGMYFAGNSNMAGEYRELFENGNYDLSTIINQFKNVIDDNLFHAFAMRNAQVVLRDDVRLKYKEHFKESGVFFAYILEKAFEL